MWDQDDFGSFSVQQAHYEAAWSDVDSKYAINTSVRDWLITLILESCGVSPTKLCKTKTTFKLRSGSAHFLQDKWNSSRALKQERDQGFVLLRWSNPCGPLPGWRCSPHGGSRTPANTELHHSAAKELCPPSRYVTSVWRLNLLRLHYIQDNITFRRTIWVF